MAEIARDVGQVTVRNAHMELNRRYKIDVSNEAHPTVCLNINREDAVAAWPEIMAKLADWHRAKRRRDLVAVDDVELVDSDAALERAVGDDEDGTELAAQRARSTFEIVSWRR